MPNHRELPSTEKLNKLLFYDPDSGEMFWRVGGNNSYRAGHKAGTAIQRPQNYRLVMIDGVLYKYHRICWKMYHDKDPGSLEVVHLNKNGLDNRISNLKAMKMESRKLMADPTKSNSSGIPGVYWDKGMKKWRARLRFMNRSISLGMYKSKEEAAVVIEQARRELVKASPSKERGG